MEGKGSNERNLRGVCLPVWRALWEVTVLLLCRHRGCISGESGPLFAITPNARRNITHSKAGMLGAEMSEQEGGFQTLPVRRSVQRQASEAANTPRHICKQPQRGHALTHACSVTSLNTHVHAPTNTHTHTEFWNIFNLISLPVFDNEVTFFSLSLYSSHVRPGCPSNVNALSSFQAPVYSLPLHRTPPSAPS